MQLSSTDKSAKMESNTLFNIGFGFIFISIFCVLSLIPSGLAYMSCQNTCQAKESVYYMTWIPIYFIMIGLPIGIGIMFVSPFIDKRKKYIDISSKELI